MMCFTLGNMNHKKLTGLAIIFALLLVVNNPPATIAQEEQQQDLVELPSIPPYPALHVWKYFNNTEDNPIKPNEVLHVQVNITNFGNSSAYNLTVVESAYGEYSGKELSEPRLYNWTRLDRNSSVLFDYYLTFPYDGLFRIGKTEITYYDENNTQYKVKTRYFMIEVKSEKILPDLSDLWLNVLWLNIAVIVIPVLIYMYSFKKYPFSLLQKSR